MQESFFQKIKIVSEVIFEIAKFYVMFIVKYDERFFAVVLFCFNTYTATDILVQTNLYNALYLPTSVLLNLRAFNLIIKTIMKSPTYTKQ